MPYYITDKHNDCSGWAVVKADGELVSCQKTKTAAIKNAVAISLSEKVEFMGELNKRAVDTYTPPQGVRSAAKRALKWIEEGKAGQGFTAVGRRRATQLANGEPVSLDTINRMRSYFARHEVDKQATGFSAGEEGYPTPGRVAWDAWGGDAGKTWVEGINTETRDQVQSAVICDIDDTLIHNGQLIADTNEFLGSQEKAIMLVTGRLETDRANTVNQLAKLGIDYDRLFMNDLSSAQTVAFKKRTAEELLKNYNITLAIDNDGGAREAYASLGIPVIDPTRLPVKRDLMAENLTPVIGNMEAPEPVCTKADLEARLKDLLGNVVAFKFLAHGFHWNVRGINFQQFHEFFGEIYEDADNSIDPIAESIRKINFDAPFKLQDFLVSADELEPTDSTDPLEMCRSLYMANEDVREGIVHALQTADELEEQGIVNFLAERQDMHSKWQWQLRAIVGDSFARQYEIDVYAVAEGQSGETGEQPEAPTGEDEGNPPSAMTNPDGTPMVQMNSADTKWQKAAALILRKLDPETSVEFRGKTIETRVGHTEFELRATGDGMTFEGYAAVFNSPSEPIAGKFVEYVAPGAFKRSLDSRNDVKLLWNHDSGQVLGSTRAGTLKLVEDSHGLKATAILPNTQLGRDTAELIKRGDVANMSFGFTVPAGGDTWADGGAKRTLNSIRLHEVSVVAWPAYTATSVSVRSIDADTLATSLEALENGDSLNAEQAKLLTDVVARLTDKNDDATNLLLAKKRLDLLAKQ